MNVAVDRIPSTQMLQMPQSQTCMHAHVHACTHSCMHVQAIARLFSGWHVCFYVSDFSGCYHRMEKAGLINNDHPYRWVAGWTDGSVLSVGVSSGCVTVCFIAGEARERPAVCHSADGW